MGQAILIADNDLIAGLYAVNLKGYVDMNVTIQKDIDKAREFLEMGLNVDAIIIANSGKVVHAKDVISAFLLQSQKDIPLVIMGEDPENFPSAFATKSLYDLKFMLQTMAKILEITAKEMAQRPVAKYYPIPCNVLSVIDKISVDIFIRKKDDEKNFLYHKIASAGADLQNVYEEHKELGTTELFIESEYRLKFISLASAEIIKRLTEIVEAPQEKLQLAGHTQGIVAEQIFEDRVVNDEIADISNACISAVKDVVKGVPKMKSLLAMLVEDKADFSYKHSVLATFVATQIIKKISWGSEEQAAKITFAFFFHDLFLVPILKKYPDATSEEDLLFNGDVSDADKEIILDHAQMAGEALKSFPKLPMGADMLVTQHHGMANGKGFAVNFKDDISPLAKVMAISEEIAITILNNQKSGAKQLLNRDQMMERLHERFRPASYKKIIEAFAKTSF